MIKRKSKKPKQKKKHDTCCGGGLHRDSIRTGTPVPVRSAISGAIALLERWPHSLLQHLQVFLTFLTAPPKQDIILLSNVW
jgi:hypothetical protein